jgi:hypothetical protein
MFMGDVLNKERTDTFSAFTWYRSVYAASTTCLFGKQLDAVSSGWRLLIGSLVQDFVMFGSAGPTRLAVNANPPPLIDGRRHHYGFTKTTSATAAGVTFYFDGVAVGKIVTEDTLAHTTLNAGQDFQVGLRGSTLPFIGGQNDLSIWNRVLTAPEVAEIYNAGVPPDLTTVSCASALEAWWPLDDSDTTGSGNIIDHGPNGYDGTASGPSKGMHNVIVAPGTSGGLGTTSTVTAISPNAAGATGGPSSFGFLLSAYGGGAGGNTTAIGTGNHVVGGSGGGLMGPGAASTGTGTTNAGGEPSLGNGLAGFGGGGSASPTPAFVTANDPGEGRPAMWGGGAGGFGLAGGAGRGGAQSRKGGGGGGPGGGSSGGQNGNRGGASGWESGRTRFLVGEGGLNGDGTAATGSPIGTDAQAGADGDDDHAGAGGGGGGAGDGIGARGGRGGNGGIPGGGGGGGGCARYASGAAVTSGDGGDGARGEVTVYTYG